MKEINCEDLKKLELTSNEQVYEYQLELAKAKARFDAELYYKNSRELRSLSTQKAFLYSLLSGLVGVCIGFWLSEFTK